MNVVWYIAAISAFVTGLLACSGDFESPTKESNSSLDTDTHSEWLYRREVKITHTTTDDLAGYPLLVVLPPDFDYSHTHSAGDGRDIRFASTKDIDATDFDFDLEYYIEDWDTGRIWVRLDATVSSIYMFYGNDVATDTQVTFEKMFPNVFSLSNNETATLTGEHDEYDYIHLSANSILYVGAESVLKLVAKKIVIDQDATIFGVGRGWTSSSSIEDGNTGRGGDYEKNGASGGGGGYGSPGGDGAYYAVGGTGYGAGGAMHGEPYFITIEMGSSGGLGYDGSNTAGNGGAGIYLEAQEVLIAGAINANGDPGTAVPYAGGGGGSGGGVLIVGNYVTISDSARISVIGGDGGNPTDAWPGGGGGGGGRIKVFHDNGDDVSMETGVYSVFPGAGGVGTDPSDVGEDGIAGTVAPQEEEAFFVTADVQDEQTN